MLQPRELDPVSRKQRTITMVPMWRLWLHGSFSSPFYGTCGTVEPREGLEMSLVLMRERQGPLGTLVMVRLGLQVLVSGNLGTVVPYTEPC